MAVGHSERQKGGVQHTAYRKPVNRIPAYRIPAHRVLIPRTAHQYRTPRIEYHTLCTAYYTPHPACHVSHTAYGLPHTHVLHTAPHTAPHTTYHVPDTTYSVPVRRVRHTASHTAYRMLLTTYRVPHTAYRKNRVQRGLRRMHSGIYRERTCRRRNVRPDRTSTRRHHDAPVIHGTGAGGACCTCALSAVQHVHRTPL